MHNSERDHPKHHVGDEICCTGALIRGVPAEEEHEQKTENGTQKTQKCTETSTAVKTGAAFRSLYKRRQPAPGENGGITPGIVCFEAGKTVALGKRREMKTFGKIRYNHKGAPCKIRRVGADLLECEFDEPVRAVTPGQALVLYDGPYILGGGIIV